MNSIEITNLNFSHNKKVIFTDFNLKIKKNKWTTIVGSNGSGKSTLIKLIVGLLKSESGHIKVENIILSEETKREIRGITSVVFSNPDTQFVADTVLEEISFALQNMNIEQNKINKKVNEIIELLELDKFKNLSPHQLSGGEKQLIALASALVIEPKVLILDEAFAMIDTITKEKILNKIKDISKLKKMTIINVTHDMEETLYSDYIVVIDKEKIILNGKNETVYKEEKTLKKLGLELPFIISLSSKLQSYELIDKNYTDTVKLVNKLWK